MMPRYAPIFAEFLLFRRTIIYGISLRWRIDGHGIYVDESLFSAAAQMTTRDECHTAGSLLFIDILLIFARRAGFAFRRPAFDVSDTLTGL